MPSDYCHSKNMKKITRLTLALATLASLPALGGNPERVGSAGAAELLINPWARSAGYGYANFASVSGVEATFLNIAGLASIERTEVVFANTQWLVGSGIQVNAAGLAQKVGQRGVLSLSGVSFNYGEWEITTTSSPEGTGQVINPSALNIGVGYAQRFTDNILGGVNIKMVSNQISNLSALGICFDAGVQYHTGDEKEFKFGITLRNVGPSIQYNGDGQSLTLPVPTSGYSQTFESRTSQFELPTQLGMGVSYDINFEGDLRLTPALAFTSNSFQSDFINVGAEFAYKTWFMVRAGYAAEYGGKEVGFERSGAVTGLTGGISFNAPVSKTGSYFGVDYTYRATNPFSGIHTIGIRFSLQ
jgi:hypothetical protein